MLSNNTPFPALPKIKSDAWKENLPFHPRTRMKYPTYSHFIIRKSGPMVSFRPPSPPSKVFAVWPKSPGNEGAKGCSVQVEDHPPHPTSNLYHFQWYNRHPLYCSPFWRVFLFPLNKIHPPTCMDIPRGHSFGSQPTTHHQFYTHTSDSTPSYGYLMPLERTSVLAKNLWLYIQHIMNNNIWTKSIFHPWTKKEAQGVRDQRW